MFLFFLPKHCPFHLLAEWEGSSLLSGGRESVLVEWRDATEKNKEFLPRLGATIEHISVSPAGDLFCTSHSDNSKAKFVVVRKYSYVMHKLPSVCGEWKIRHLRLIKSSTRFNETFFFFHSSSFSHPF